MIVRRTVRDKFTVIENDLLNDESLDGEAIAIAVILLSKPNDWEVRKGYLQKRTGWGEAKVTQALQTLARFGYLKRERERTADGTHITTVTKVAAFRAFINDGTPDERIRGYSAAEGSESEGSEGNGSESGGSLVSMDVVSTDVPKTDTATAAVFTAWTDSIPGTLTPTVVDTVHEWLDTYSPAEIVEAIRLAVLAGVRTPRYIAGILRKGAFTHKQSDYAKDVPGGFITTKRPEYFE